MENEILKAIEEHAQANYVPNEETNVYSDILFYKGLRIDYSVEVEVREYEYCESNNYGFHESWETYPDMETLEIFLVETCDIEEVQTTEAKELKSWARKTNKLIFG